MTSPARVLRPALSLRYQQIRRASTKAADVGATLNYATTSPGFLRRNRGRIAWSIAALVAGVIAGNFVNLTVAPPALPDAGTPEDRILMTDLNRQIDAEFKVQVLRGKCLGVSRQLKGKQPRWVELVKEADTDTALVASLAGAKGLGVERLFWNRDEETLVAVVWFGGSLSGWPGVTHGGLIATQLLEKIGMVASLMHGSYREVSSAAVPQRLPGTGDHAKMLLPASATEEPEQISFSYVKPTWANGFYVIRVGPALPLDEDPANVVPDEPAGGRHDYEATLETIDARILVKAKAKLPVVSQPLLTEHAAANTSQWTSEQFKQWMWPSRQKSVQ